MSDPQSLPENGGATELVPVVNQTEVNAPQATAAEGDVDQQEQVEQPAKTFTQAEVEALIAKRLAREARKSEREMAQRLAEIQQQQSTPEPKREDYANDEAHQRAQLEHEIQRRAQEQAERIAAQREEQRSRQSATAAFWARADEVAERFPDLEQVVSDPSLPMSQPMAEFVISSEIGPELAYHLGKNRGKAGAIAAMGPIQAARELMKLESELSSKPKARPSAAPEPINPVGNRGRATTSASPSDEDDIDTWMRKERQRTQKLR